MTDAVLSNATARQKAPEIFEKFLRLPPLSLAPAWNLPLALLAFLSFFALLTPTAPSLLADADMFWHIRTGQEILATGHFPLEDAYSWTFTGKPWIAKEWLSQVLYAGIYALAGWTGVAFLALAAAASAYALVFAAVERRAGPIFALAATLCLALAGNFHLVARPHVLAWPVAALFAIGLLNAAEQARAPGRALLALMVLWTNLHGSFLFGFILLPFFALESLARAEKDRIALAGRWAGFAVLLACMPILNPYGCRVFTAARDVLALGPAMSLISEWRPQNFASLNHFEAILLLALGAGWLSGIKIPLPRVALLLALLYAALAHVRQEFFAIQIGSLLLAAPVAALQTKILRLPKEALRGGFLTAGGLLLASGFGLAQQGALAPVEQIAPVKALAAARAAGVTGQVLNEDQFGGYLIAERIPTYVDGRAELFGAMHYQQSLALAGRKPEKLAEILADKNIGWTFLPSNLPANEVLAASPDWRAVYRDETASVFLRIR